MPIATRTFRVFVSSTFEDLKAERNALAAPGGPFEELTKVCQRYGARFQAIDLRWGVREEAGHDQRTMEICLGEIERCQQTKIKPNFIILLGDRYGWRPLPARVDAEEFEAVRERISDATNRKRVDEWYRLDENEVPPEYLLRPRTGEFKDKDRWGDVEAQIHKALREAARAAGLSRDALIKYQPSATHQEILQGLGKTAEDREHVFAFFCKPSGPNEDPDLSELKQFLREQLRGNVFEPRDTVELCKRVRQTLKCVVRNEGRKFKSRPALDLEVEAHDGFARDLSRIFLGRGDVLGAIDDYIRGPDRRPMVVHGASGSGKSALMARASTAALADPGNAVVIRRFIGATPESSSGITLLRSLCSQIGQRYGLTEEIPLEFHSVVRTFADRLALATAGQPLVLFIDALDQIAVSDPAAAATWLMPELPPHCRVVVSMTEVARSLERSRIFPLQGLPAKDAEGVLALWLHDAKRRLQDRQRTKVLDYYNRCGLPLYLKLAFEEARRWRSFDEPEVCLLLDGLAGIIDVLFARLSSGTDHGKVLVNRSLGYLAAARYGLTEDEMLDVLTRDEDVWQEFDAAKRHDPPERRLPVIVWSRLYLDLEPYLTERVVPGGTTVSFYHRQLAEKVGKDKASHAQLARYFGGQSNWRGPQLANERRITELIRQQVGAGAELLDEMVATITDLDFVSAKCVARLVFDLEQDYREAITALQTNGTLPKEKTLRAERSVNAFSAFFNLKAHLFAARPELVFQEAFNQSSESPVHGAARVSLDTRNLQQAWLEWLNRDEARGKLEFGDGTPTVLEGQFPLCSSKDSKTIWMLGGTQLVELADQSGSPRTVWDNVPLGCQIIAQIRNDPDGLLLVGARGEWIFGVPGEPLPRQRGQLDFSRGEIAAWEQCSGGFVVVVSFFDHSPARLGFMDIGWRGEPRIGILGGIPLGFGYKPKTALAVLPRAGLAVCAYGEKGRDLALVSYKELSIIRVYTGHVLWVDACCAIEELDLLVSGSQSCELVFHRLSSGDLLEKITLPFLPSTITWCAPQNTLFVGGNFYQSDGVIAAWNLRHNEEPLLWELPGVSVGESKLSNAGDRLYIGSIDRSFGRSDGQVTVGSVSDLTPTTKRSSSKTRVKHDSTVFEIHVLRKSRKVVTTSRFGQVWTWDALHSRRLGAFNSDGLLYGTVVSEDERWIAVAVANNDWEYSDGVPTRVKKTICRLYVRHLGSDGLESFWEGLESEASTSPTECRSVALQASKYFEDALRVEYGPLNEQFAGGKRGCAAQDGGVVVSDLATGSPKAFFPIPETVTALDVVDQESIVVGDRVGYVWFLRFHEPAPPR